MNTGGNIGRPEHRAIVVLIKLVPRGPVAFVILKKNSQKDLTVPIFSGFFRKVEKVIIS